MTRAYMSHGADGTYTICCSGHATGSEAVCAAVSCLVYTLAGWLTNRPEGVEVRRLAIDDASAILSFCGGEAADTAYRIAVIGLLQLARSYPDHISAKTG